MDYIKEYNRFLSSNLIDEESKKELLNIKDNNTEIEYRFSKLLDFGTAGLRGVMGIGINMMNIYTIRHTTFSLGKVILNEGEEKRGVVICHDPRNNSDKFALEAALTLCNMGIKVYLFDDLRPTPELSFGVRHLKAISGINITASHNTKEYNGYKVYWEDGAQLSPDMAHKVHENMIKIDVLSDIKIMEKDEAVKKGLLKIIGEDIDNIYLEKVLSESEYSKYTIKHKDDFKVVYTPFHGCGYKFVPYVLSKIGLDNIIKVESQMVLDGNFSTVKSPNPENADGFNEAIKVAKKNNANIIIGTDPDADRVGVMAKDKDGEYKVITGNQVGALLLEYIIMAKKEKAEFENNFAITKSIVTTNIVDEICKKNNVKLYEVLTGFKFVGKKIKEIEEEGIYKFIYGFEESIGYLKGSYARDKDGIVTSMLVCEMACYYYDKGMDLFDALNCLYEKYGYFDELTESIYMEGLDGEERIKNIGVKLRKDIPTNFSGTNVIRVRDYQNHIITNLKTREKEKLNEVTSDVLFFELEDGCDIICRPSGTEPKIKLYILSKGSSVKDAKYKSRKYMKSIKEMI
ncbi:phospho-sugar mutase [Anaerofustis sp. NSJ-163]|uniref:phospho-sugar mutase n=1 Tax=Anaerofustis sp. NSJ-163 TaxID=2944391 RepID=UPI00209C5CF2|nr:phospho-sugar mutase [Anaerofustis sp. NSJ-163]MCO8194155.1 phospho-sugar mutase [Anaerofustis sp. NSJ-163]